MVEVYGVVFDIWYTPIREADGEVSGVIGVANDITERRRFEEALRRSEESSRALVQHATYGIYRSTLDGRLLAVNPALVRMLGYDSEEQLLAANLARDVYADAARSEEHTSELQSHSDLVCRLLLEKKKKKKKTQKTKIRMK